MQTLETRYGWGGGCQANPYTCPYYSVKDLMRLSCLYSRLVRFHIHALIHAAWYLAFSILLTSYVYIYNERQTFSCSTSNAFYSIRTVLIVGTMSTHTLANIVNCLLFVHRQLVVRCLFLYILVFANYLPLMPLSYSHSTVWCKALFSRHRDLMFHEVLTRPPVMLCLQILHTNVFSWDKLGSSFFLIFLFSHSNGISRRSVSPQTLFPAHFFNNATHSGDAPILTPVLHPSSLV